MKKFSEVLSESDNVRKESAQKNLAQAVMCLDEGKRAHLKAVKEIEELRAEIVEAGDNLDTITTYDEVRRLYDAARKIGGTA